jgi:PPM family protein phosphatase
MVNTKTSNHSANVSAFGISHVGKVRSRNEDFLYIDPEGRFLVLADGMGGHKGGKEASQMAVFGLAKELSQKHAEFELLNESEIAERLSGLFAETSHSIFERGRTDPELENMGATLCLWLKIKNHAVLAHVGDSRIYVFREKNLFQLTQDHTMLTEHRRALGGGANEIQNLADPRFADPHFLAQSKHILVRNVGIYPSTPPDICIHKIFPKDIWLLCSDGLSNKLTSMEIGNILVNSQLQLPQRAQLLVEEAYDAGGQDNITVILAEIS